MLLLNRWLNDLALLVLRRFRVRFGEFDGLVDVVLEVHYNTAFKLLHQLLLVFDGQDI